MVSNNNIPEEARLDLAQTIPPTHIILEQKKFSDFDAEDAQVKYLKKQYS